MVIGSLLGVQIGVQYPCGPQQVFTTQTDPEPHWLLLVQNAVDEQKKFLEHFPPPSAVWKQKQPSGGSEFGAHCVKVPHVPGVQLLHDCVAQQSQASLCAAS
jgi:hypothetical protein